MNCATVRGDGAMSALFGHVRGAFTGAVGERPGLLRAADGGLLFLDEIAELGPDEQAMLLRAIEEKRFLPVGSDKEVEQRLSADRRHQLRSAVGGAGRAVSRGPAGPHQPVDLPPARACATGGRTSSRISNTSWSNSPARTGRR